MVGTEVIGTIGGSVGGKVGLPVVGWAVVGTEVVVGEPGERPETRNVITGPFSLKSLSVIPV